MPQQRRHDDRVPWSDFLAGFRWRQGEHVSLIGPTGGGKTTLALALLPLRQYVVVLGTKPRDNTLDRLRHDGYRRIRTWSEKPPTSISRRLLLWPRFERPEDMATQAEVLRFALREIFREGGWCVFADELRYLCDSLRLRPELELYWQQGRSINLSLMGSTQRPAHVPVMVYDQATHLFFWRDNDDANLKRIGGIGYLDAKSIRTQVAGLARHDVLYLNTRTGDRVVTRVDLSTAQR